VRAILNNGELIRGFPWAAAGKSVANRLYFGCGTRDISNGLRPWITMYWTQIRGHRRGPWFGFRPL